MIMTSLIVHMGTGQILLCLQCLMVYSLHSCVFIYSLSQSKVQFFIFFCNNFHSCKLTAVFHLKLHFAWRKSATKILCVKTVIDKVVGHSLAYLCIRQWLVGASPSMWKFGEYWPTLLHSVVLYRLSEGKALRLCCMTPRLLISQTGKRGSVKSI